MGIFRWLTPWRRRTQARCDECTMTTTDQARELDQRQHEVARRLHILEYETSEAVQAMRRRKQEEP
jgi:hypothetical protein